ncbi:MAG: SpoIIE family protein phosphatase [Candidatus Neomarinimicrobiota bacterium]
MADEYDDLQTQLVERRTRLQRAISEFDENSDFIILLAEVDAALERVNDGTYGVCEDCHEAIEADRLQVDPLLRLCLDHLTSSQKEELERDLSLASRIQDALLPENDLVLDGWEVFYHYEPAGPVSGDYCDLVEIDNDSGASLVIVGDVSGKGIAASMIMSHMHAMFHSLVALDLPISELMERVNRLVCESTPSPQHATLVLGKLSRSGIVEICNAGHWAPLLTQGNEVTRLKATGLPVGLFCNSQYSVNEFEMSRGDSLLLYTDGLHEARKEGNEYGEDRVARLASELHTLQPQELIEAFLKDVTGFLSGTSKTDDLTMMAIQRVK